MIYGYLQEEKRQVIDGHTFHKTTAQRVSDGKTPYVDLKGFDATTRREITGHYYRHSYFEFSCPTTLELFLSKDVWDEGFLPATLVRDVRVPLTVGDIGPYGNPKRLVEQLGSLYKLQVGSRVDIHISAGGGLPLDELHLDDLDEICDIVEHTFPTLLRLREMGQKVTLELDPSTYHGYRTECTFNFEESCFSKEEILDIFRRSKGYRWVEELEELSFR
jgi:hypothetical protein